MFKLRMIGTLPHPVSGQHFETATHPLSKHGSTLHAPGTQLGEGAIRRGAESRVLWFLDLSDFTFLKIM